jgi:hypothetical protein
MRVRVLWLISGEFAPQTLGQVQGDDPGRLETGGWNYKVED